MPPKKTSSKVLFSSPDAPDKDEKIGGNEPDVGAVSSHKVAAHPPTMTMVKEALKELDSKKGVSSQAIRKYIFEKHPSVDMVRLKYMLRKALMKGMESGVLVRPANYSPLISGAQGRFRLAPKKAKEPELKTAENTDPNVVKATKAGAKKPKETGAGAEKKKATVKKQKDKSSEDSKPAKKGRADTGAATSKVAPAKKPKAKKVAVGGPDAVKDADGEVSGSSAAKGSKKKDGDKDKPPATKAAGTRRKKTAEAT